MLMNTLLEMALDFLNGELSAEVFADSYMDESRRLGNDIVLYDDRLLEATLSSLFLFADMYYEGPYKNPEVDLDGQELCVSVYALLVNNGIIEGYFCMDEVPEHIRPFLESYIEDRKSNIEKDPERYTFRRKPIKLKKEPCPAARFKIKN